MIFESHAHYDDKAFDIDREELLSSMKEKGIEYIVNVSADLPSITDTMNLTTAYDFIYGAVGIHPSECEVLKEEDYLWIKGQAERDKVVAIGEIGLDYYWKEPAKELQLQWFKRQLLLAKELNKPVIIHSRDAAEDTLKVLQSDLAKDIKGVVHCYSYTKETAKTILNLGYYFGIGGVVTFSNAKKLVEAVEYLPLDHILLETDSPYLAPTPYRGQRNSSLNIPLIATRIAEIKGISYEEVVETTNYNAKALFFNQSLEA